MIPDKPEDPTAKTIVRVGAGIYGDAKQVADGDYGGDYPEIALHDKRGTYIGNVEEKRTKWMRVDSGTTQSNIKMEHTECKENIFVYRQEGIMPFASTISPPLGLTAKAGAGSAMSGICAAQTGTIRISS